jgi:uncharacterized protein YPO0396
VTSSLFSPIELEDQRPGRLPGCRLQRLEVYNWGTFDRKIWSFELAVDVAVIPYLVVHVIPHRAP